LSFFHWTAPLFKLAGRRWSEDDFAAIAERLSPYVPDGGILADLGGGTGDLGAGVARVVGANVVVIDPTAQMLRRVSADPLVSVCLSSAEHLPFPDGHFDALLCSDAFHHLRDQRAAAREIARVVRPGGGVLLLELDPSQGSRWLAPLERALGEPAAFLTPDEMEALFARHGVQGNAVRQRGASYLFAGVVKS
jgi:ubiquinone/menaquinone biosynthesis C-methylase UbiE